MIIKNTPDMIAIGLTGSIASGKTFVLEYFARKNFPTFSADEYVRELYQDQKIQKRILEILPELKDFNKNKIATLIYEDNKLRIKLQDFIHPFVRTKIKNFAIEHQNSKLIIVEVPLLFESQIESLFDVILVTICNDEKRLIRAKSRDGFSLEIYQKINQIQLPQEEKAEKADFVLNTNLNQVELEQEINKLIVKLLDERNSIRYRNHRA